MGIQGLLKAVRGALKEKHISQFAGKSIAVDGYSWIHKSLYGSCFPEELQSLKWMNYSLRLIDMLLTFKIIVYMVFDGSNLPQKMETDDERAAARLSAYQKGLDLMSSGDKNGARMVNKNLVSIFIILYFSASPIVLMSPRRWQDS